MARTYIAPPTGEHREFAYRFREACARAKLSTVLKELAKVFGVSKPTVHEWRHGSVLPSTANMALIASKTGVNVDWLATGRGSPELPPSYNAQQMARRIDSVPLETQRYIDAILTIAESQPAGYSVRHT